MRDYESPEQIEHEIERTRAGISHTITALQQKLSPGSLFNQTLVSAKGGSVEFASNLGRAVRDNPMPVFLLGVGLTWLVMSGRDGGRHRPPGYRIDREDPNRVPLSRDTETSTAAGVASRATGAARTAADTARTAAETARAKVSGLADQAKSQAQETSERLKETATDLRARVQRASEGVREGATVAYRRTTDTAYRTRVRMGEAVGSVGGFIREYPIVVGALAVALGAGLAMLIPSTRREDELMGEASDAVKEAAKEKAIEVKETVAEQASKVGAVAAAAAGAAIDTARQEAERKKLVSGASQSGAAKPEERAESGASNEPAITATEPAPEMSSTAAGPASGTATAYAPGGPAGAAAVPPGDETLDAIPGRSDTDELSKPGSEPGDIPAIPGYTREDKGRGKKA